MVGDRYKYKESSICRVVEDRQSLGRVKVLWEGEHFTSLVDVTESCYEKIDNQEIQTDNANPKEHN